MNDNTRPDTSSLSLREAPSPTGGTHDNSLACYKCYIKHLSKAAVQADELVEDPSRIQELSLCMGNIACAEDHARALGLSKDVALLRAVRNKLWYYDRSLSKILMDLAVTAVSSFRSAEAAEAMKNRVMEEKNGQQNVETPEIPEKSSSELKETDSNDNIPVSEKDG